MEEGAEWGEPAGVSECVELRTVWVPARDDKPGRGSHTQMNRRTLLRLGAALPFMPAAVRSLGSGPVMEMGEDVEEWPAVKESAMLLRNGAHVWLLNSIPSSSRSEGKPGHHVHPVVID